MKTASDLMRPPVTVGPNTTLRALAETLLEHHVEGACVLEAGKLVGVVTTMDLVFREKKVHLPTLLHILDAVIPLGSMEKAEREMARVTSTKVGELMTRKVITVGPSTAIDEVATLMVEKNLTILPVVDKDKLVGVVTKPALLAGSSLLSS